MEDVNIRSNDIELVSVNQLIPYEKNMNQHTDEQIDRLVKLIEYQGFRNPIIAQRGTNRIAGGHGRLLAAQKIGMEKVPVVFQEFESEEQFYAYVVSDNAIAKDSWASLDLGMINAELENLGPELDVDMLGLKDFVVEPIEKFESGSGGDNDYTKKVEIPIYEPTGPCPELQELRDSAKTNSLVDKINRSTVDDEVKLFLIEAAQRHNCFNYEKVAEYYAHADKDVQELMEDSALVIIDFNKAIEDGFVKLTDNIAGSYD